MKPLYRNLSPKRVSVISTTGFKSIKTSRIYLPVNLIARMLYVLNILVPGYFRKEIEFPILMQQVLTVCGLMDFQSISIIKSRVTGRYSALLETGMGDCFFIKVGDLGDSGLTDEIQFHQNTLPIGVDVTLPVYINSGICMDAQFLITEGLQKNFFWLVNCSDWEKILKFTREHDLSHPDLNFWNVFRMANHRIGIIDWENLATQNPRLSGTSKRHPIIRKTIKRCKCLSSI